MTAYHYEAPQQEQGFSRRYAVDLLEKFRLGDTHKNVLHFQNIRKFFIITNPYESFHPSSRESSVFFTFSQHMQIYTAYNRS